MFCWFKLCLSYKHTPRLKCQVQIQTVFPAAWGTVPEQLNTEELLASAHTVQLFALLHRLRFLAKPRSRLMAKITLLLKLSLLKGNTTMHILNFQKLRFLKNYFMVYKEILNNFIVPRERTFTEFMILHQFSLTYVYYLNQYLQSTY